MSTPKYNAKIHATVVRHVRRGAFLSHAAGAARISRSAVEQWIAAGDRGEEPYVQFALDVASAMAEQVDKLEELIRKAATSKRKAGDWKAAAWLLERKFPKLYGGRRHDQPETEKPRDIGAVHSPWLQSASQPARFDA